MRWIMKFLEPNQRDPVVKRVEFDKHLTPLKSFRAKSPMIHAAWKEQQFSTGRIWCTAVALALWQPLWMPAAAAAAVHVTALPKFAFFGQAFLHMPCRKKKL